MPVAADPLAVARQAGLSAFAAVAEAIHPHDDPVGGWPSAHRREGQERRQRAGCRRMRRRPPGLYPPSACCHTTLEALSPDTRAHGLRARGLARRWICFELAPRTPHGPGMPTLSGGWVEDSGQRRLSGLECAVLVPGRRSQAGHGGGLAVRAAPMPLAARSPASMAPSK